MPIRLVLAFASALLLASGGLLAPGRVAADCQPVGSLAEALAGAPVAFVGTVVAADPSGPRAIFQVEEVWAGDLPATVEVRGISDGAGLGEDDRTWQVGSRYLVIPYLADGGVLRDSICSGTAAWRDDLAKLRPPGAETRGAAGSGESDPGGGLAGYLLLVVALTAVAGALVMLIGRRRSAA
jgi:hypothetical protein